MDSLNIGTVIVGHELSRYANWKESFCTGVGKFLMVSALAREVDRGKHHSVYRGERDRVDAYARTRWWCCSPHQLTLLLPLFNHQFSGASNQLRIKHLSSGLRATIYQQCTVWNERHRTRLVCRRPGAGGHRDIERGKVPSAARVACIARSACTSLDQNSNK